MLSPAQSLLLDLLSPARTVAPDRIGALVEDDWKQVLRMARDHRLEPLLHHEIALRGLASCLPQDVSERLQKRRHHLALQALNNRRALLSLAGHFQQLGVPFLALKGAWLAWKLYPHPDLRPMRDVDILVPRNVAISVFNRLKERGFTQVEHHRGSLESILQHSKHLPGLLEPETHCRIEVHGQLLIPSGKGHVPPLLSDFAQLYSSALQSITGGGELRYPPPTVTLLQIIVHAADEHFFNNGPLIIRDVYQIISGAPVDWPLFWKLAEEGEWTTSAMLVFDLVEDFHGPLPIDRAGIERKRAPREVLEAVLAISLQPRESRAIYAFAWEMKRTRGARAKAGYLLRRLFPPRAILAEVGNVDPASLRAFTYYPAWLAGRLRRLPRAQVSPAPLTEMMSPVVAWLDR